MMRRNSFFALLAALLTTGASCAAQSYALRLRRTDGSDTAILQRLLKVPVFFDESAAALSFIRSIPAALQEEGYLAASVDSISPQPNAYECLIYLGSRYRWVKLDVQRLPPVLQPLVAGSVFMGQQVLRPAALARTTQRLLRWSDEHGYPFARVYLDSVEMEAGVENGIHADLRADLGPQRRIDKIVLQGNARIEESFLVRYLDMPPGSPYNERRLEAIADRLRNLPYLQVSRPPAVSFKPDSTLLTLTLDERKSNALDGLIGLLPNSAATGKFLLTIDAQARFQNILSYGESLAVTFQKLQERSSNIRADGAWPYLFGTAFGADARFELYKRDTLFSRTTFQLGTTYAIAARDALRVYYDVRSNRIISPDTVYVRAYRQLPKNVSAKASGAGLELTMQRTDNALQPRRGTNLRLGASLLRRRIEPSDAILGLRDGTGFDYASLYDSLVARSNQYNATASFSGYLPLGRRLIVKAAYNGGYTGANAPLFQNELYQIGGFRLLRGFDEQSIWASQYHIATAELRAPLDAGSYIYLFGDGGWVETAYNGYRRSGVYSGFGAGATLQTKGGLFTIAYALGTGPDIPLRVRQSKIHFGFLALF